MVYRATVCVVPYEAYKESEERCFFNLEFSKFLISKQEEILEIPNSSPRLEI